MNAVPEQLHFYRYEFKYVLDTQHLEEICDEFDRRLSRDRHSSAEGHYDVRSVYFDSPGMRWFHEKKNGLRKRNKYRLRAYELNNRGFTDPLYLEMKGRDGFLVLKHRARMDADPFRNGIPSESSWFRDYLYRKHSSDPVTDGFLYNSFRYRLFPSVITDYRRTAWEDSANPDFRTTIDTDVTAYGTGWNGLPSGPPSFLLSNKGVLEVKFRYRMPFWFQRLIRYIELNRVSFSKFQHATEAVYLEDDRAQINRLIERNNSCLH